MLSSANLLIKVLVIPREGVERRGEVSQVLGINVIPTGDPERGS